MQNARTTMATRAVTFSRLVLALVVALVLGAMLVPSVDATKAGKNTVASIGTRIGVQRDYCEILGGGTLTVKDSPFVPNKITTCTGGTDDGKTCVHTPKKTVCDQALTTPPSVQDGVSAPLDNAGVLDAPTGGGNTVGPPAGGQIAAQTGDDRQHNGKNRKK